MLVYYPIQYQKQTATLVGLRQESGQYEFGIFFCESKPINLRIAQISSIKMECRNSNQIKINYPKHTGMESIKIEFLQTWDRKDFLDSLFESKMIEFHQSTSITCCWFPCIAYFHRNYKFIKKTNPIQTRKIITKIH